MAKKAARNTQNEEVAQDPVTQTPPEVTVTEVPTPESLGEVVPISGETESREVPSEESSAEEQSSNEVLPETEASEVTVESTTSNGQVENAPESTPESKDQVEVLEEKPDNGVVDLAESEGVQPVDEVGVAPSQGETTEDTSFDESQLTDSEDDEEEDTSEVQDEPPTLEELRASGILTDEPPPGKVEILVPTQDPNVMEVIKVPEIPEPAPELLGDAYAGKYASRHQKATEGNSRHTPGWPWADEIFMISSHPPQRSTSVMGKIYNIVALHKDGIKGSDLVAICRDPSKVRFDTTNSKYVKGGIVVAAWVEDYIVGMCRVRYSHLKTKSGKKAGSR